MNFAVAAARVRILVVDDHAILREALGVLLEREDDMQVVGFAATGEEAVLAARRLRPEVIIMDLMLPEMNGIDATLRILEELPLTLVIALSACHTREQVRRALRAGARGFVLKAAASDGLRHAVKAAQGGRLYLSPDVAASFTDGMPGAAIPKSPFETLSAREREILKCIVGGSSSSDIAQHLSLSRKTVETYRSRMMHKLGVASRSALIHDALRYELPGV